MKSRLLIFCSGQLGFKCLIELFEKNFTISSVMTDKSSGKIQDWCKEKQIPCYAGNPNQEIAMEFVRSRSFDLGFSINYLFLLKMPFIETVAVPILNIHGSLLPKYRGRTPHVWAIINGETKTGVTVHKVDAGCDTGDILLQQEVEITKNDTGGEVLKKYEMIYPRLISQGILLMEGGTGIFQKQDASVATEFPKRTPEDGQISWAWNPERIRNWVRAQTKPYPGAFTYAAGVKVIIWEVEKMLHEQTSAAPGTVLRCSDRPVIATQNGAVAILSYEFLSESKHAFSEGEILS